MRLRIALTAVVALLALTLTACATTSAPDDPLPPPAEDPAGGIRLAPGLYDLEDGGVQAIGTVVRVDLEGGFWALVEREGMDGESGGTVAVFANGDEFDSELRELEGTQVSVIGTRFDGASIRMAGPEIVAEEITPLDDTPGAAE